MEHPHLLAVSRFPAMVAGAKLGSETAARGPATAQKPVVKISTYEIRKAKQRR
jgi:hypothetical protein